MARWLTRDYICEACGRFDTLLSVEEGQLPPDVHQCPECGATAVYAPSFGSNFKVALPDGTRRFDGVREQRTLAKAARAAKRKGDQDTLKRALVEQFKTGQKVPSKT